MINKFKELKEMTKIKGRKVLEVLEKNRKVLIYMALYASVQMNTVVCYAKVKKKTEAEAKSEDVVAALGNLKTLLTVIVSAVGVVVLVKNIMEFASAYQQADSSGMNTAVKGIVGGFMMFSIGSVITFLGISS